MPGFNKLDITGITVGAAGSQHTIYGHLQQLRTHPKSNAVVCGSEFNGNLQYTPIANQAGVATITIRIEDGGLDNNLNTTGDNLVNGLVFVTVNAVQVINLPWLR
jgi:hypothetical protein